MHHHHHHHHHHPCNRKPITVFSFFFYLIYLNLHSPQTTEARNPSQFTINPSRHNVNIPEIKRHLHRFGYLQHNNNNSDDVLFHQALSRYQKNLGLPITGKPDSDTLSHIQLPRCGFPDNVEAKTTAFHTKQKYVYFPGRPRWTRDVPLTLTYAFSQDNLTPYLTPTQIRRVFRRAFSKWASVIPVSFVETEDYVIADIKIGFFAGDHGDGEPFDGVLGVLAHTFSPENGRLHLDKAETWAVDFHEQKSTVAVDLESVAVHEIGHALGLGHSSVKDAAMYPTLKPRSKKVDLNVDDVVGVQSLYGTNPNFNLSSLLASETSTNLADGTLIRSEEMIYSTLSTLLVLSFLNL